MGSQALPHRAGRGPAVLFAGLDLQQLTITLGLQAAPRNTTFVMLDHHGAVVARVPAAGLVGRRVPERPLVETVLTRRHGTAEVEGLDGVRRIYGFTPVAGNAHGRIFIAAGRSSDRLAVLGLLIALALSYTRVGGES